MFPMSTFARCLRKFTLTSGLMVEQFAIGRQRPSCTSIHVIRGHRPPKKPATAATVHVPKRWINLRKMQSPDDVAAMPTHSRVAGDTVQAPNRRVHVWGFAQYGALGVPNFVRPVDRKKPLKFAHHPARLTFADKLDVVDVACGYGFTVLAVNSKDENKVFGTGLNTDSQIGYHAPRRGNPLEFLISPAPIDVPLKNTSTKVKQVACGRAHTVLFTDKEGVFTLGNNAYGQCGRPIVDDEQYKGNPRIFRARIEQDIDQVICSQDNTIFVTKSGEVFICGWGADGQTGTGSFENMWKPSKVIGDFEGEKIVQVSCAADCILAVSDKGDVFGWGNSEYGQLSSATSSPQVHTAHKLRLDDCGKITQVAAAGTMCAALNNDGEVYVWGYGILGKGPVVQQSTKPTQIPTTLFGRNEFNPDVRVTKLYCGLDHFMAMTNDGDVYAWGRNKQGCLGLGHDKDQFFPLRVSVPARVFKISCGVDHTATLSRSLV